MKYSKRYVAQCEKVVAWHRTFKKAVATLPVKKGLEVYLERRAYDKWSPSATMIFKLLDTLAEENIAKRVAGDEFFAKLKEDIINHYFTVYVKDTEELADRLFDRYYDTDAESWNFPISNE